MGRQRYPVYANEENWMFMTLNSAQMEKFGKKIKNRPERPKKEQNRPKMIPIIEPQKIKPQVFELCCKSRLILIFIFQWFQIFGNLRISCVYYWGWLTNKDTELLVFFSSFLLHYEKVSFNVATSRFSQHQAGVVRLAACASTVTYITLAFKVGE